jgi:tape measure domain-containing protein
MEGGDQSLMANVDDKVVSMSFESSKFETGVSRTISALDKLKASLNFPNAGKGLTDISSAADKVDLGHIGKAIDTIKSKFSWLGVAAVSALNTIVSKAVSAGISFVKSFTIDPIVAGFKNYETQINAVQVILANTGLTGKKGLDQVNAALQDLNTYANKTVYNFSEMTKNIGTFTAAGVDLKTSTESIKGIANLAALSGSNSQQASTAMYQLSQAIAANAVKLQDWNSVVNAGMGGKVFQEALFNTGKALHTIKNVPLNETFKQWTDAGNTFRGSLKSGWVTGKVLTQTLQGFTGDMTKAQLKAQGYTDDQIKNIQKMGKVALGAATNIKTYTQLTEALKEEVATAYATIFKTLFGNINMATKLFSGLHVVLENALTVPIYKLNTLLEDWAKLGGRTVLIDAIKKAWAELGAVAKTVKSAFTDVFPPTTGKQLYDLTVRFDNFIKSLKPSPETLANLKRTFEGLFSILDIGKQILSGIFIVFGKVFGAVSKGGGGFLSLTATIGDFIKRIDEALKKGDRLHNFFETLGNVLAAPLSIIGKLGNAISSVFSGVGANAGGGFTAALGGIGATLTPLQKIIEGFKKVWDSFVQGFGNADQVLQPAIQGIADLFGSLGTLIATAIQNINFNGLMNLIRTGLLGGIFVVIKKFFSGDITDVIGGGVLKSISGAFEGLTGALGAMQQSIKAGAIEKIAIAVALLAASIIGLSMVDAKKMNTAMAALTIGFTELLGAFKVIDQISSGTGFIKLPFIAAGLIGLAAAVDILVLAVKGLSGLSWTELAKGLGGVSVLLVGISAASKPLSANSAGMITAGVGITAIAIAMKILASAVKDFGGLSWTELGKGIGSVAASLALIGLASKLFPSGMVAIGVGLIAVGAGLKLIANAVGTFGKMDLKTLGKGIGAIAVALLAIALAVQAMPATMAVQAAGLLLVSFALQGIAKAVGSFGGMSIGSLAKGLIALAASLAILAAALIVMQGSLGGAAALIVAAGDIAILAPAIQSLGKMSWGEIIKAMVAMAAAFVLLGAAGILLEPVAPALLALGAAMTLIGAGFALVGAGIFLIGAGLSAIAIAGPTAIAILLKGFTDFMNQIPVFVKGVVSALLSLVTSIAAAAPQFVTALGKILVALANAVIQAAPQLAKAFDALIQAALKVIKDNYPTIVQAGLSMLLALITGIRNNIGQVVSMVAQVVITLLNSIASHIPKIVAAGVNVLLSFVQGIANSIGKVISVAASIIANFVTSIGNGLGHIINAGGNMISKLVNGISDNIGKVLNAGGNAIAHFITGIGDQGSKIINAGVNALGKLISALGSGSSQLAQKGADAMISFLNSVASTIRTREPALIQAGFNIGAAIVQGMINGIGSLAGQLTSKALSLISSLPGKVKKFLHIGSPSKVFYDIGVNIMLGLIGGIDDNADNAGQAVENVALAMTQAANAFPDLTDINPTITPVVDLTHVQAAADQMSTIFDTTPVATASYGQAASISSTQAAQGAVSDTTGTEASVIKFEQNNYSPESLSPVDIYRQTKNQLSQMRTALANA